MRFLGDWWHVVLVAGALLCLAMGYRWRPKVLRWLLPPTPGRRWEFRRPDVPGAPDFDVGRAVLPYLFSTATTHRRVEKVRFAGTDRMERRVSVDTDLVAPYQLVPIGLVDKRHTTSTQRPLRDFSVSGEAGALPLLGFGENAAVAWSTLCYATVRSLRAAGVLPDRIAGSPDAEDQEVWERLVRDRPGLPRLLWEIAAYPTDLAFSAQRRALVAPPAPDPMDAAPASSDGGDLILAAATSSVLYQAMIRRLTGNFLLVAQMPTGTDQHRAVIKYSLADAIPSAPAYWRLKRARRRGDLRPELAVILERWEQLTASERARYRGYRLLVWLGWMSESVTPTPLTLLPARSVHFELEAPDGVRLTYAELSRAAVYAGASVEREYVADAELHTHPTLAHMFLDDVRLDEQLSAQLTVTPRSLELGVACALATGLAWYLWLRQPAYGTDRQGEEALVLLLPAVLGSYLLLKQHTFVQRIARGVRVLVALASLVAVATAALVIVASGAPAAAGPSTTFERASDVVRAIATAVAVALVPVGLKAWPYTRLWPRS